MGREKIMEHIKTELSGSPTENTHSQTETKPACQQCGTEIETGDQNPDDYVVHSIPSHGKSGRNPVFYCSPSCFQTAMDELLSI